MIYAVVGLALVVFALGAVALLRRPRTNDRGDHVAPSVLTRINAEYNEHRR